MTIARISPFALLAAVGTAGAQVGQTATFSGLGNVDGAPGSNPNGCFLSNFGVISGDGATAFGTSLLPGTYSGAIPSTPFVVGADGGSPAFLAPGDLSLFRAVAVSADGTQAVGNNWFWDASSGLTNLEPVLNANLSSIKTVTDGALDAGRLAGSTFNLFSGGEPNGVFIWDYPAGTPTLLNTPNLGQIGVSLFVEISDDGSTLGSSLTWPDFGSSPAIWGTDGSFELLGDLNPADRAGGVADLSADGSVVVGFSRATDQGVAGFRWTRDGGLQALSNEFEALIFSPARAVTADGSTIVGQYLTPSQTVEPYIWTEAEGLRNLTEVLVTDFGLSQQLAGWTLVDVYDISFGGETIIGFGINPQGCTELFTVTFTDGSGCAADVNGNGAADPGDFTAWVAAYNQGEPVADQNENGEIDPGDFTAFIANFNAGC